VASAIVNSINPPPPVKIPVSTLQDNNPFDFQSHPVTSTEISETVKQLDKKRTPDINPLCTNLLNLYDASCKAALREPAALAT